jgi:CBS domain-containing protein
MNENHIGCIPVCNDEKNVVGVLTDRDIVLRTVACDKNAKTTPVSEIMTTNVCTCGCEEDVIEAENAMARNQIRRIPVVDSNNKMVGILTMGDLAHNGKKLGSQDFSSTVENICDCKGSIKNCC